MHATLCDYLADIVQNSIEAGATLIEVGLAEDADKVNIRVKDNGKGMDAATQARIWSPFYSEPGKHSHRRVGLGLPMLRQAVEAANGHGAIESAPGRGTTISFSFDTRHWDAPPLGDVPGTLLGLMTHDGGYDLRFERSRGDRSYAISRDELAEALGDLREVQNLVLARDFLRGWEDDLTTAKTTNNNNDDAVAPGTSPAADRQERNPWLK